MTAPPVPVVPVDVVPAGADPSAALLEALLSGPLTVSALAGVLLPLVTGLVTGRAWPPTVKGLMLAALSFASAVVAELVARESSGREVDCRTVLTAALVTWVTAQVAHQGVWRHTAISQVLQRVRLPALPAPPPARDPEAPPIPWGSRDDVDLGGRSVTATIRRATTQQPGEPRVPRDPTRAARARRDLTPPRPVLPPEPVRLPRPTGRRERAGPRPLDDR